ncbi:DUF6221 family protein [Streptomyces sp. NPDC089919]|uniref:DUF6221 family protein n=1 Tax=Streptomyces sp. NPDC089919 TaxID=3155188 RepID=UPI003418F087
MDDDLVRFLRACLDEDERAARAAPDGTWGRARVLAQVQATRMLLDASHHACAPACATEHDFSRACGLGWMGPLHEDAGERWLSDDTGRRFAPPPVTTGWTLRVLTLPYAGRPGYRHEWWP